MKHPMDLKTIREKLGRNEYIDPWAVCDDVRLMVDNACIFNKKGSRVYKAALKVLRRVPCCLARRWGGGCDCYCCCCVVVMLLSLIVLFSKCR